MLSEFPTAAPRQQKKDSAPQQTDCFYGKVIRIPVTPMKDVTLDMGTVAVDGKVFAVEHKELKKRNAWVISFDITDNTGSVRINRFMETEESAQIRKEVKVALSGECADEIFGGYPWYRDPEIRSQEGFPWAQNTNQRIHFLSPALAEGFNGADYVVDAYRSTCAASDILPDCTGENRRMKEMVNLNQRWFMQTLLDRKDRMSMFSGLEVRVPFCDYRIAQYLYGVPWEFKNYQGKEKGLLRHAMTGILPEEVLWRKKSPYPKTFDPKYTELISSRLRSLLGSRQMP